MLPKLLEEVKPVARKTEKSIGELVQFTCNGIPPHVWRNEYGSKAPRYLEERHEHHLHLHYNDYRQLTHHVKNVVNWQNETPLIYWPTPIGFRFVVGVIFVVIVLVLLPEIVLFFWESRQHRY